MFNKRINIFTGHFGSGKTEVAVNYALKMKELYDKTAIVDFDIVNPYFRTADARKELEEKNIWVLVPMYANTNVDVPSLPPEINALFEKKEYRAVFDVGGDDLGARVISRYRDDILEDDYEMFFVVNTRRIMTNTPEKIIEMLTSIEESARIKVTKLVNNSNLLGDTSAEDIISGYGILKEVSEKLDIPAAFSSGFSKPLKEGKGKIGDNILYMEKLIKLPWD